MRLRTSVKSLNVRLEMSCQGLVIVLYIIVAMDLLNHRLNMHIFFRIRHITTGITTILKSNTEVTSMTFAFVYEMNEIYSLL